MKRAVMLLALAPFAVLGCGSDDDGGGGGETQSELADMMLVEGIEGVDEDCLRDKTDELSDEDAQFLIDNIDGDAADFSAELQEWVDGLLECLDADLVAATAPLDE